MVIVLILVLFLSLSFYALDALNSASGAQRILTTLYKKEQALLLLNSALPQITALLDRLGNVISLNQEWAKPIAVNTPLGLLDVKIVDLDRYLDVNGLNNPQIVRALRRLCLLLDINSVFIDRLMVWEGLKPNEGFEFQFPPKKGKLDSLWELTYVWNNTSDLFGKKEGFIEFPGLVELLTVYSDGKVNVNTAPYWVLRSLDEAIDDWTAREIMERRKERPFRDLLDLLGVGNLDMDALYRLRNLIKFSSRYFKIELTLKSGDIKLTLVAVYDRVEKKIVEKEIY